MRANANAPGEYRTKGSAGSEGSTESHESSASGESCDRGSGTASARVRVTVACSAAGRSVGDTKVRMWRAGGHYNAPVPVESRGQGLMVDAMDRAVSRWIGEDMAAMAVDWRSQRLTEMWSAAKGGVGTGRGGVWGTGLGWGRGPGSQVRARIGIEPTGNRTHGLEPLGSNPRARTLGIELVRTRVGGFHGTRWMSGTAASATCVVAN